jgi:anti-sigma regulatory factor (Ser/Thr protein kinase)
MDDCLEFESDPQMAVVARQFVRDRLEIWEATSHIDTAVLVTSELVTNAVLHARTAVTLRLAMTGDLIRIEVFDENPRLPVLVPCPPEATSGRGLALISALSSAWGMEHRDGGKTVWAEIGPQGSDDPDECVDLCGVDTLEEAMRHILGRDQDTATQ